MNSEIRKLLESVRSGETSVDDAMLELKKAPLRTSATRRSICTGRCGRARQR